MAQTLRGATRRSRAPLVRNPAWTTTAVADSWELIESTVKPAWLPHLDRVKQDSSERLSGRVHEYGCGSYGCVFPTHDPMVVLKVTSDPTEAEFAVHMAPTLVRPISVFYHSVVALNQFRQGRRVYLLWRESANKVGELEKVLGPKAVDLITNQHVSAQRVFKLMNGHDVPEIRARPKDKLRIAVESWVMSCEAMARQTTVPQLRELGDGMVEVYERQRVFFGDLHANNLGLVHREDGGHWVITDPGYASVISPDAGL